MRLVEDADVVVENFRPDVKDRMGIGYESLSAVNPRIILASISGFGQSGPYRMRAGFDQIAQGMGGLMWVTGMPGSGPMRAGIAVADSSAGVYAATGILIALAEREQSGRGQWVQTSLLQAQIAMMDFQAARYLIDGVAPARPATITPTRRRWASSRPLTASSIIGVGGDGQWRALCDALGRPELGTAADYATNDMRLRNRPKLTRAAPRHLQDQALGAMARSARAAGRAGRADLQGRRGLRRSAGAAPRHRRAAASPDARRCPRGRHADYHVAHAGKGGLAAPGSGCAYRRNPARARLQRR